MAKRGEIGGLGERPLIMGILNVTPDSFSDGGKFSEPRRAVKHAVYMAECGADIIDIGGESSRPGSGGISEEEEVSRVIPVIREVCSQIDIPVSIDTTKYEVARQALNAGASIINDISALRADGKMTSLAAENGSFVILMHMRGTPANMQQNTKYDDLITEVFTFLKDAVEKAISQGISHDKIIIDPGIGFGKSADGNLQLLKNLHKFLDLGFPVLVGASRKAFIGKELKPEDRLGGSIAAACYAVLNGADVIRVHDISETRNAISLIEKITGAPQA
jgi:dihydropteroate synthase